MSPESSSASTSATVCSTDASRSAPHFATYRCIIGVYESPPGATVDMPGWKPSCPCPRTPLPNSYASAAAPVPTSSASNGAGAAPIAPAGPPGAASVTILYTVRPSGPHARCAMNVAVMDCSSTRASCAPSYVSLPATAYPSARTAICPPSHRTCGMLATAPMRSTVTRLPLRASSTSASDERTDGRCPTFHATSLTWRSALYSRGCPGVLEKTSSW